MPLISSSTYRPVKYFLNGHMETIIPSMFRKIPDVHYTREVFDLSDGDFVELDWCTTTNSDRLIILSHGLEGSSDRHYVRGMAKYFHERGWDVLAWNCRSCGGSINKLPRMYHHAATEDLEEVITKVIELDRYSIISLVGFSMGGNLTLKYLGEHAHDLPSVVNAAAVFSTPCDLAGSSRELDKPANQFYRKRFLKKLKVKLEMKASMYPELINCADYDLIKSFTEFDDRFTAPMHGFLNAMDFYDKASAKHYIPDITIPVLIVNAENDPFLSKSCYPIELAEKHRSVFLEVPSRGGHVGFPLYRRLENWMEVRAYEFITEAIA